MCTLEGRSLGAIFGSCLEDRSAPSNMALVSHVTPLSFFWRQQGPGSVQWRTARLMCSAVSCPCLALCFCPEDKVTHILLWLPQSCAQPFPPLFLLESASALEGCSGTSRCSCPYEHGTPRGILSQQACSQMNLLTGSV